MSKSKDKPTKRYVRIDRKKVAQALHQQIATAAAHLDFEGVAYIKLIRTGPQECFGADVTSQTLGEGDGKYKAQEPFWKRPAMEKFGEPEK